MSVSNGQVANATTFNTAFISRTVDSSTVGQLDLLNADSESGDAVFNIQREFNATANWLGRATNAAIDDLPSFAEDYVGAAGDNALQRLNALVERFSASIGHTHDGTDGEGPLIDPATGLTNVRLRGYMVQGANLSGVSGGTADVSTALSGKPISSGDTVAGVPVLANNKVILRDNTAATKGDILKSAAGDEIYAKLTNSGGSSGTWTLTFYTNVAGVETAYSSFSSQAIQWYYQQLYNPIVDAPIYSEWLNVPSDNATQDVIEATSSLKGKVLLASAAAADIASSGSAGTANATVANADHVHKGVFSFGKSGGTALFGAVTISGGTGITITTTSQDNAISLTPASNNTVKGNKSGISAAPTDYALSDITETGSSILTISNASKCVVSTSNVTIQVNLASGHILVGSAGGVAADVAMSGDITITNAGVTAIGANKVTLAMMAQIATASFLGRTSASTGNVEVLTATQATALLDVYVGDSGSGGTKGLVKAPASGDAAAGKFLKADGNWAIPTGGGGGGALQWVEDTNAPTPGLRVSQRIYTFAAGLGQSIYCAVRVPTSYIAGNPIKLRIPWTSAGTSGNVLVKTVATLIRTGTDAVTSTTNQRTSTNSAVTVSAPTVDVPQAVIADLSSSSGQINAVNIAAGDIILVQLTRDATDTCASDVDVYVYAAEVTFS